MEPRDCAIGRLEEGVDGLLFGFVGDDTTYPNWRR
jgi:hypothetical protein